MATDQIVQKLWTSCNVLRDDSMSWGDYAELLTYLLFLNVSDERIQAPYDQPSVVPRKHSWSRLIKKDGDALFDHYRHTLDALGRKKGLLGLIFNKAQNKLKDPAKLPRPLADLIDKENWSVIGADVKDDAYEGLLEKNAQDTKSGAGQYFASRPLIQAVVAAVAPEHGETIAEPDDRFDLVLANPPFGKKSSTTIVGEIEAQVDINLKRAERLRQSILGRAFTGELPSSFVQAAS